MEIYDVEQRVQIINFYFQYQSSIQEMFPALLDFMLSTIVLFLYAESTIRRLVAKFESTGSIFISQHPYVTETQGLLKTSVLCMTVYGKTRSSP